MADLERGKRIKALRKRKAERLGERVTQQDMADAVGVTLRAAQEWDYGGGINDDHLPKLLAFLETDADYLLRGGSSAPIQRPLLGVVDGGGESFTEVEPSQLDEIERKLNLLLDHHDIDYAIEAPAEGLPGSAPASDPPKTPAASKSGGAGRRRSSQRRPSST